MLKKHCLWNYGKRLVVTDLMVSLSNVISDNYLFLNVIIHNP